LRGVNAGCVDAGDVMSVEGMADERLIYFYESIRQQVEADRPHKHRLTAGPTVRQYADQLGNEITKRRLKLPPIQWPY
jgi:hypothetical protein